MAQHPGRALKKLITSLLDLVGMEVEILRKLDQGLLVLDRSSRHFRLEYRTMIPA
jgi:hypothetical protein